MIAGIAVSAADPSGLWCTLRETRCKKLGACCRQARNSNELSKAAITHFEKSDEGRSSVLAMRERFGQAELTDVHRAYRRRSAIARPESSEALSAEFPASSAELRFWRNFRALGASCWGAPQSPRSGYPSRRIK
jgi:hypothetical protein